MAEEKPGREGDSSPLSSPLGEDTESGDDGGEEERMPVPVPTDLLGKSSSTRMSDSIRSVSTVKTAFGAGSMSSTMRSGIFHSFSMGAETSPSMRSFGNMTDVEWKLLEAEEARNALTMQVEVAMAALANMSMEKRELMKRLAGVGFEDPPEQLPDPEALKDPAQEIEDEVAREDAIAKMREEQERLERQVAHEAELQRIAEENERCSLQEARSGVLRAEAQSLFGEIEVFKLALKEMSVAGRVLNGHAERLRGLSAQAQWTIPVEELQRVNEAFLKLGLAIQKVTTANSCPPAQS